MSPSERGVSPWMRVAAWALVIAAACYAGASVGSALRFPHVDTAIVYPPYAIVAAALMLSPPRHWAVYLLAGSVGTMCSHRESGFPLWFVLLAEVANYVRAVVAAAGVRRFGKLDRRFETFRAMAVFVIFVAIVAPCLAAFLGAADAMLRYGAAAYWPAWRAWLLSNTLTGLTLLPIILAVGAPVRRARRPIPARRLVEAVVLIVALFAVGWLVLLAPATAPGGLSAPLYAPLPLLLWATVRFGPVGISASLLVVAALAIWGTLDGRGPFVHHSPFLDLVQLQLFLFVTSVPFLLLSALLRERQRTVQALHAREQQYRAVVEDQDQLICRFHPDGTLTFVNGICSRSLSRAPEELLGSSFWSMVELASDDPRRRLLAGLTPEHPLATWEREWVPIDGDSRWEHWTVRALFEDGRLLDYQAIGQDVTERRRADEQRRLLQAQQALAEALRETNRRKDAFLALLAHELRNPLSAIAMATELMRQSPSRDERLAQARRIIDRQTAQLTRLVEDLLDIARITSGKLQLRAESLDFADVVAGALETSRPLMAERRLQITVEVPSDPMRLRGDALRLTQLVANLLSNAAKYTQAGGRVGVAVTREEKEVVLRVADGGVGIPREMLESVFEPLTQVDGVRDRALGGLGLGLSLVKRLTELHGGTVTAYSDGPGRGSTFEVRLPAAP